MGKKSKKITPPPALPKAPWVYLNDPSDSIPHARYLRDMIPSCAILFHSSTTDPDAVSSTDAITADLRMGTFDDTVAIINDNLPDSESAKKLETAAQCRAEAIKHGCNFASVNLYLKDGTEASGVRKKDMEQKYGTNHLELCVSGMTVEEVAKKVYRWLFSAFAVIETLHLIPESEMLAVDSKAFPDYEYCPISESKDRPKDAKIQFVAVVTSRPTVVGQRLQWTVADRTGTANFYFQYRGAGSQYTWDWVLKLQPGDRKALPRMPMVQVKERKRVRVAKAPFRTIGFVVSGVGLVVRTAAHGVVKLGDVAKMGKSSEWVPEADVVNGKKVDWSGVFEKERRDKLVKIERNEESASGGVKVKVFNEKGEKLWKDDDSVASTTLGAEASREKEFC